MIPVFALVGRSNVGKSTLFNRLTHTRNALVADFPGLTRDRKYGHAEWEAHSFIVIDTGGIDGAKNGIGLQTNKQSLLAIEEADLVLFIVDGRAGLIATDQDIAQDLRNRKKNTIIVANKTEGIDADSAKSDFYALGMAGDIISIAASHGRGIDSLLRRAFQLLLKNSQPPLYQNDSKAFLEKQPKNPPNKKNPLNSHPLPIMLAIVGRPNVGKSTLTNRILGEERVVVYDTPSTTRDSIYIPMVRNKRQYTLIDTAGVRKRAKITEIIEKFSVVKTLKAIESANVVILVIDARKEITDQDVSLLDFILSSGKSVVIAINKCDGLSIDGRVAIKEVLDCRFGFIDFARIHFISALCGTGIGGLFQSVNEAYQGATKCVGAAVLTRIMQTAIQKHQPPIVRGRRIKPKYAHSGGHNPPIVVIHGAQVTSIPDNYRRYLMHYFCRSLDIMGTPIRIQFKETPNPFFNRKNILTPTQLRKRKRLRCYIKKKNK